MGIAELALVQRTLRVVVVGPPSTVVSDMSCLVVVQIVVGFGSAAAVVAKIALRNSRPRRRGFQSTLAVEAAVACSSRQCTIWQCVQVDGISCR